MLKFERYREGETIYKGKTDDIDTLRDLCDTLESNSDWLVIEDAKGNHIATFETGDNGYGGTLWKLVEKAMFALDFDNMLKPEKKKKKEISNEFETRLGDVDRMGKTK